MDKKEINAVREKLTRYNEEYRKGCPLVSDREYDSLVEILKTNSPDDVFFKRGVAEVANIRMESLPTPMFSLEKIKNTKDLTRWLLKLKQAGEKTVILTPKYDGISLVVQEGANKVWTRGDGERGQRSDYHFKEMNNGTENGCTCEEITWGEAIIKKSEFYSLRDNDKRFNYKNGRNMVAGIFNSPDGWGNAYIKYVDYVRYGSVLQENRREQLVRLRDTYNNATIFYEKKLDDLLDMRPEQLNSYLDDLFVEFGGRYSIDGVVLEANLLQVRNSLGRLSNQNPAYAIAFKREDWLNVYVTKVVGVEMNIGKSGTMNPTLIIKPVKMDGATVSRATAYNAAYVIDNNLHPGAEIEIIRSGDVIPKHLRTLSFNDNLMNDFVDELVVCPSCGGILAWDENYVNLICANKACPQRVVAEMTYFFKTIGCTGFEEPTVKRLYQFGHKNIQSILDMHRADFKMLLGDKNGEKVYQQIHKAIEDVPFARYMTAINLFEGVIAEKTCQKILDGLNEKYLTYIAYLKEFDDCYDEVIDYITAIPGIGDITATHFVNSYNNMLGMEDLPVVNITNIKTMEVAVPDDFNRMYVAMSGFRSKELVNTLAGLGHIVCNGVTKECNVLVVADINANTDNMRKAKNKGIRIVDRKTFENEIIPKG